MNVSRRSSIAGAVERQRCGEVALADRIEVGVEGCNMRVLDGVSQLCSE